MCKAISRRQSSLHARSVILASCRCTWLFSIISSNSAWLSTSTTAGRTHPWVPRLLLHGAKGSQHTRTIFPFSPCVPGTPASSVPLLMIQLHFQGCWPCAWTLLTPVLSSPSARLHDPSCQPRLTLTVLRSPLTMDGGRREPKSQSGCAETKSGFVLYNIHFRVALCI